MTAIALTPNNGTASVLIEITGAPAGALTILRSDTNGTNLVRLYENQVPITGALTVTDTEAALGTTLTYKVTDSAGATDSDTTSLTYASPMFIVPVLPLYKSDVTAVIDYDSRRDFGGSIHEIVGREDPIPVLGKQRFRSGTIRAYATSYEAALAVEAVCARGEVIMLRQPTFTGLDMYFVAQSISVAPDFQDNRYWTVDVDYQQVGWPTAPLLAAAGWSFDDLANDYDSFAEVASAFSTFSALTVGP